MTVGDRGGLDESRKRRKPSNITKEGVGEVHATLVFVSPHS